MNNLKTALKIILIFITFNSNAQNKTVANEVKISKAKLAALITVKEIISDIPADCLIGSFECSANTKDGIATVTNNSDDFNAITKNVLATLKINNRFYISNFKAPCSAKLKKEYSFVVTE